MKLRFRVSGKDNCHDHRFTRGMMHGFLIFNNFISPSNIKLLALQARYFGHQTT
ncbi:hypothetical protein HanLR1_Chr01g0003451 [Helianthus annuus]|nr:hypothetical protein HanHA89_Chr01g0004111 [Helianthus annuus]KAJ0782028.1 hypothetical protein HanLR1_Chr01g0003451 [Helianthus annuus]